MDPFNIFRYVDDFSVLNQTAGVPSSKATDVLDVYRSCGEVLEFTQKEPVNGKIQFLNHSLNLMRDQICGIYEPRSKKGILPFSSVDSKIAQRGIALVGLKASLGKWCAHGAQKSFTKQVARLQKAGCPPSTLAEVVDSLINMVKGTRKQLPERDSTRPVVIQNALSITHNLKQVAHRYEVPVVFSALNKL